MTWIICWYAFWDSRCFKKYLTFYANVSIVERQAVFGRAETCPPEPGRMKVKKKARGSLQESDENRPKEQNSQVSEA